MPNPDLDPNPDWPFLSEMPPERPAAIQHLIRDLPFFRLLGLRSERVEVDCVTLSVSYRPDLTQPAGILHGGVHATLIDAAVAWAIGTTLKEGYTMLTVRCDTNYFKPTSEGRLAATGRIVRKGKTVVHGEVEVVNGARELVAKGWCIYAVKKIADP